MLTPARIARLAQTQEWQTLLREVLANGRPLPKAAAERLERPSCVRAAAAALGLCRTIELTRGVARRPDRSPARVDAARPLLDALRESARSSDPVARAFALAGLAAVGHTEEERSGALGGEGSPLDALLAVWAFGGVFAGCVRAPAALSERPDPAAPDPVPDHDALAHAFERAARAVRAMDQRSPLAADLRAMLALASIALRRAAVTRRAA